MTEDEFVDDGDDGTGERGSTDGSTTSAKQDVRLTPVFKLLLTTIFLLTITSSIGGYGAIKASQAAGDTKEIVQVVRQQTSPAASRERRQQLDDLVTAVGGAVDCNNASRLKGLATSLEGLLGLPEGAIVITPCAPLLPSTTTTTPKETP